MDWHPSSYVCPLDPVWREVGRGLAEIRVQQEGSANLSAGVGAERRRQIRGGIRTVSTARAAPNQSHLIGRRPPTIEASLPAYDERGRIGPGRNVSETYSYT